MPINPLTTEGFKAITWVDNLLKENCIFVFGLLLDDHCSVRWTLHSKYSKKSGLIILAVCAEFPQKSFFRSCFTYRRPFTLCSTKAAGHYCLLINLFRKMWLRKCYYKSKSKGKSIWFSLPIIMVLKSSFK